MTNNHKPQGEWKIYLTMAKNSSKNYNETQIMHSKSDDLEVMMGSETD